MNRRNFFALAPAFPVAAVTATLTLREQGKPDIEGLDVSVLKLQPGDGVVLQCDGPISHDTADRIRATWEAWMPGTKAIVMGDGLSVKGVLRGAE
jgi:hypothetical protein